MPSSEPVDDPNNMDLAPHLTNTALQDDVHESSIRLLKELVGCNILSGSDSNTILQLEDVQNIEDQVSAILAETFKAALASAVHFQVLDYLSKYTSKYSWFFDCRYYPTRSNCSA